MAQITNEDNPMLELISSESKKADKLATLIREQVSMRSKAEEKETALKVELKELLKPAYFAFNEAAQDEDDVWHTFDVGGVQVDFTKAYFIKDKEHLKQLTDLLGSKHPLTDTINQTTKIVVDVSTLTPTEAKDIATSITNATKAFGIRPTVESKAEAKQEFHDLRHIYLTPEDNMTVDEVLPLVIQVTPI